MYSVHLSGLVVRQGKIHFFAQDLPSIMNTHTYTYSKNRFGPLYILGYEYRYKI